MMYLKIAQQIGVVLLAGVLVAGCANAQLPKILTGETRTKDGNAEEEMKAELGEYHGLKHALGVIDFENQAGYVSEWKLGYNLGLMLESALYDSGRFVIVERDKLDAVLAEQDLQASGRMAKAGSVAATGKLRSARYLATGAVTEVDVRQAGGGAGVRIKGFKLGLSGGDAKITAIVKLIDTTTGEIVAKERVTGKAGKRGLNVGYGEADWGVDLGGFVKTPLGQAAQDVINQAVLFFAGEMEDYDFTASVVLVKGDQIIINRGSLYGVHMGQRFAVETKGEQLTDPETGEILGMAPGKVVARIEVVSVDEKIAICKLVEGELPERGAVVKAGL